MADGGDFEQRFNQIVQHAIPERLNIGMKRAALALLRDAVMETPRVPIDEGTLRGSGSAFVGNALVSTSPPAGGQPTPATTLNIGQAADEIVATVGFNTPYAAHLHEHPEFHFTDSQSGGKYLGPKMVANRERYMKVVAAAVREGAGA